MSDENTFALGGKHVYKFAFHFCLDGKFKLILAYFLQGRRVLTFMLSRVREIRVNKVVAEHINVFLSNTRVCTDCQLGLPS
jgi:hypothetical protein